MILSGKNIEVIGKVTEIGKKIDEFSEAFGGLLIASAIVDRLLHHSHVAKITGNFYRLKVFSKR